MPIFNLSPTTNCANAVLCSDFALCYPFLYLECKCIVIDIREWGNCVGTLLWISIWDKRIIRRIIDLQMLKRKCQQMPRNNIVDGKNKHTVLYVFIVKFTNSTHRCKLCQFSFQSQNMESIYSRNKTLSPNFITFRDAYIPIFTVIPL